MPGSWLYPRLLGGLFGGAMLISSALAAVTGSYRVRIASTGNAALDRALADVSDLVGLEKSAPVGGFALILRAEGDQPRLDDVLQSFGYYAGRIAITIAGRDAADPDLPAVLDLAGTAIPVAVHVNLGPVFHIRSIILTGNVPTDARARIAPVAPGAIAAATDLVAAQQRLLDRLREDGYALAAVATPVATEDPAARVLDVTYQVNAGAKYDIGAITLVGLRDVDPAFVRRRLLLHAGELVRPRKIEAARQDLAATGLFSSVAMKLADRPDAEGRLGLIITFVERPKHTVGLSAAYSTDLGGSAGVTWTNRNMLGAGEQLSLHATGTGFGGSDTTSPGYDIGAEWLTPDWRRRDQSLDFTLGAVRQYLTAYDRTALVAAATIERKLNADWTASVGLAGTAEKVAQEEVTTDYGLLGVPARLSFDNTKSLFDPTHGVRASLSVTPTWVVGRASVPYLVTTAKASTYFDFGTGGRSVLALRALVGTADGATRADVPPEARFYAGGSDTVRGFRYQSVGPRFADGNPMGGLAIDAATIELRQHVVGNFGTAVFIDAGQVASAAAPFVGTLEVGAGAGLRYQTPIGPIRLDIAVPVNRQSGDDLLEVYIGLGQAF